MPASRRRSGPSPNLAAIGPRPIIQSGTGFELVLSALHVADLEGRKDLAEGELWAGLVAAVGRRRLPVLSRIGIHPLFNLTGLAWDASPGHDAAHLLAHLRAIGPLEVVLTALGAYRPVYRALTAPEVARAAATGDKAARREFLKASWPDVPEWQASARFLLSRPAPELAEQLIDELSAWHDAAFAPQAERILAAQEAARDGLLDERESWTVDTLMQRVLPGHDYDPPKWVREVVFVPDSVIRPGMVLVDHRTDFIATFPISSGEEGDVPPEQLLLLGKALSDDLRLRALRVLARGPATVATLATELGVPRTTLVHHLHVLRSAGLISVGIDGGRWGKLRLRLDGVEAAPRLLRGYVSDTD